MALEPGPMKVIHNFFSTKAEVLDDIKKLDLWPTTYVSGRMEELPVHWHDVDNCGYVLEGKSYVLDENGERVPLGRSVRTETCERLHGAGLVLALEFVKPISDGF